MGRAGRVHDDATTVGKGTMTRREANLLKFVGEEKQSGAGERAGNAVRAAACASLTPCASRARDGVIGERAFAKSKKGEARGEACCFFC